MRAASSRAIIVSVAAVALVSCARTSATPDSSPSPSNSGIFGVALAGPQCPVEIVGSPCPPKAVAIRVVVNDQDDRMVATFATGDDGSFRIPLPAGLYTVLSADQGTLPVLKPTPVTVVEGEYVQIQLNVDTGIR